MCTFKCRCTTTAGSRPYVDFESNMVAILFCIIDILGAISAWQSSGGNKPSPGLQILFVVALLLALIVVLVLALKATNERIRILNDEMSHGLDQRSVWKTYTKCELIFLFPVLVIVFVVSYIFKGLCRRSQKNKNKNKLTAVLPTTISKSQIEEKTAGHAAPPTETQHQRMATNRAAAIERKASKASIKIEREQSVHGSSSGGSGGKNNDDDDDQMVRVRCWE